MATLNQLLVLANLESYNAVLLNQRKNQKERMKLLRQLAVQQLQTLEKVSMNSLPKFEDGSQRFWLIRIKSLIIKKINLNLKRDTRRYAMKFIMMCCGQ